MYLSAPFILQNFKKILRADSELWGCIISGPKWPICPEQNLLGTNHYYYFHLPISPFYCAKSKKILTANPELWGCTIFGPKMVHLPQFFLGKIINTILIYLLTHFNVQNLKKILPVYPELWGCTILGSKLTHFPKWEFVLNKPVNELFFFHSCLSTCQKSKSDVNPLLKYWRLKNTEISLAKRHFWL